MSRVVAQVLGIGSVKTTPDTTVYDPTWGSGSLLLKVADAAHSKLTLYGQEKDSATSGLARMNMILHDNPTAEIKRGNTLADPKFREGKADNCRFAEAERSAMPCRISQRPASADDSEQNSNDRNDEKNMDETAHGIGAYQSE